MSDHEVHPPTAPAPPRPLGVLAAFETPIALADAIREAKRRGLASLEAFTPFPSHDVEHALEARPTKLAWFVLAAGLVGGALALLGQWWTNAVDYPYLISGKPLFSLPANIPVTFEVIILAAATTALFGMLALNGLPRLSNPLLRSETFRRGSQDRFLLLVGADEPRALQPETQTLLQELGATSVEVCYDDAGPSPLPKVLLAGGLVAGLALLVPPLFVARARQVVSDTPRLSIWADMDYQPKLKPQTVSAVFADGRASRPPVPGTVARGQLRSDLRLYRGVDPALWNAYQTALAAQAPPTDPTAADATASEVEPPWIDESPIPVTERLLARGRERYGISCAPCHGLAGDGDGLVSQRALSLEQGTWVPPTSLHVDYVRAQPLGKLYDTITNGVRKMPGYKTHVDVADRWAIALYVRALQRSRTASLDDVPPEIRSELPSN